MHRKPSQPDTDRKALIDRIARIEGQLRGVRAMIEAERGCVDVITQVSAIRQALAGVATQLLKHDLRCKEIDEEYIKALFKAH